MKEKGKKERIKIDDKECEMQEVREKETGEKN
jgi:hypothetical protein